jgi:hypothetical protein
VTGRARNNAREPRELQDIKKKYTGFIHIKWVAHYIGSGQ